MARTRKNDITNPENLKSESKIENVPPAKTKRGRKAKAVESEDKKEDDSTTRKKRKITKEETPKMPISNRTNINSLKKAVFIGAHVSGAGGKSLNYCACRLLMKFYRSAEFR